MVVVLGATSGKTVMVAAVVVAEPAALVKTARISEPF